MTKRCGHCKEHKLHEQFYDNGSRYLSAICIPCTLLARKARHAEKLASRRQAEPLFVLYEIRRTLVKHYTRKEKNTDRSLRQLYGITLETYRQMEERQSGLCAICRERPNGTKNHAALAVDHDHATGVVRELLCQPCNTGLGAFDDDTDLMRIAIAYVERHRTDPNQLTFDDALLCPN